jgi:NADH:ubiquinone oxidoreductase subunit K
VLKVRKTSLALILACGLLIISVLISLAAANPVRTGRGDVDPFLIISVVAAP